MGMVMIIVGLGFFFLISVLVSYALVMTNIAMENHHAI